MAGKRANRDEWRKRVDCWKSSGLTAKEFAAETRINAGTLQFWGYKLKKSELERRKPTAAASILSSIVEVRPAVEVLESRFEIELGNGRRLRVPTVFDGSALKSLVAILEGTT